MGLILKRVFLRFYERYPREVMNLFGIYRGLWHYGRKFYCPCCGLHFRKFLPYGVKPRPNAQCPRCFSLETHRLVWLYLQEKTNIFKNNLKLLHIAPEYAFQKKLKHLPNLEYISADLKSPLAEIKMDITAIPYGDNLFNVILCSHVLEHVPDDKQAMRELYRILKPGGWAILQSALDPNLPDTLEATSSWTPQERALILGDRDHKRKYGLDYKRGLENAGFTVRTDNFVKRFSPKEISKYSLNPNEDIYICTKTA